MTVGRKMGKEVKEEKDWVRTAAVCMDPAVKI